MNLTLLEQTENLQTEPKLILNGVTWQQYDALVSMFIDRFPALRMTYLEETLEIMTNSPEHERLKKTIARLIETYVVEKRIFLNGYGSTTFRKEAAARGLEPDECYCFGELKEVPDIAIEIVITSGGIKKLEVYRGLNVPEVWFWRNGVFDLYRLVVDQYEAISRSQLLPDLDLVLLSQYIGASNQTEAAIAYSDALRGNSAITTNEKVGSEGFSPY